MMKRKIFPGLFGIYDKELTKTGTYNALVGLDILDKGESKNEHFTGVKV